MIGSMGCMVGSAVPLRKVHISKYHNVPEKNDANKAFGAPLVDAPFLIWKVKTIGCYILFIFYFS